MLKDSLTLGIVLRESPFWHEDFARAYANYFIYKYNIDVMYGSTVDEILSKNSSKFVFIQDVSHIITDFDRLVDHLTPMHANIVVGKTILTEYVRLDDSFFFINFEMYKNAGMPKFNGEQGTGAEFSIVPTGLERTGNSTMILKADAEQGARIVEAQVRMHGAYFNMPNISDCTWKFHHATPYHELHYEGKFEDNIRNLPPTLHNSNEYLEDVEEGKADVLICHADGLSAYYLAQFYKVKKVIIIDKSQIAIDFQKMIFGVDRSYLYSDILNTFIETNPCTLVGNFSEDEYSVVSPLGVEVEYHCLDIFGWQMEDFFNQFEIDSHLVVNFGDIFMLPSNYYKRRLKHGRGMFEQIWSLMGSRQGPVRFIGYNVDRKLFKGAIINGNGDSL